MTQQVGHLLDRLREGDQAALDELMPLVYAELRRIARGFFRGQRPNLTLQPTALVNEAYMKLSESAQLELTDRSHFLALMSRAMRQVLVDHARAVNAAKRGGRQERIPWDTNIEVAAAGGEHQLKVLELDAALEALTRENESLARLIEMHYFGGMTAEEAAVVVGRSAHAVRHDLRLARAWLRRQLTR